MREQADERVRYRKIAKRIHHRRIGAVCLVIFLCVLIFVTASSMFQRAVVSGDCMALMIRDQGALHTE